MSNLKKQSYKNVCNHVVFGSTFLTAVFHFFFCGVPAFLAITSSIFGIYSMQSMNFITSEQRGYLLIIGGILLAISFFMYKKEKQCCNDKRILIWKKWILYISLSLYTIGLLFHILSMTLLTTPSCH